MKQRNEEQNKNGNNKEMIAQDTLIGRIAPIPKSNGSHPLFWSSVKQCIFLL